MAPLPCFPLPLSVNISYPYWIENRFFHDFDWNSGHVFGVWRSLVARIVRDDEVGGSNPLTPIVNRIPVLFIPWFNPPFSNTEKWPGFVSRGFPPPFPSLVFPGEFQSDPTPAASGGHGHDRLEKGG